MFWLFKIFGMDLQFGLEGAVVLRNSGTVDGLMVWFAGWRSTRWPVSVARPCLLRVEPSGVANLPSVHVINSSCPATRGHLYSVPRTFHFRCPFAWSRACNLALQFSPFCLTGTWGPPGTGQWSGLVEPPGPCWIVLVGILRVRSSLAVCYS